MCERMIDSPLRPSGEDPRLRSAMRGNQWENVSDLQERAPRSPSGDLTPTISYVPLSSLLMPGFSPEALGAKFFGPGHLSTVRQTQILPALYSNASLAMAPVIVLDPVASALGGEKIMRLHSRKRNRSSHHDARYGESPGHALFRGGICPRS